LLLDELMELVCTEVTAEDVVDAQKQLDELQAKCDAASKYHPQSLLNFHYYMPRLNLYQDTILVQFSSLTVE
jgi:hypothetical protein